VRYSFIQENTGSYRLNLLCQVMGVSERGYNDWWRRETQPSKREVENQSLKERIVAFHCGSRMTYGYRRIQADLKANGQNINKKRVARLMKQEGLQGVRKGNFKVVTTDSNHNRAVVQNHLEQNFQTDSPNQKWAADFSYIPTLEGWLYLAVVLDLFSRKVIGWAFSSYMTDDLCTKALQMALQNRRFNLSHQPSNQLIHHSDRGSQYASYNYRDLLEKHHLTPSMSRKGNCYDNAVVESFFATLKTEEVYANQYLTRQQAQTSLYSYIEGFYNRTRRHSTLGNLSPLDFENHYWQNQTRVA
jgi:putative transposase